LAVKGCSTGKLNVVNQSQKKESDTAGLVERWADKNIYSDRTYSMRFSWQKSMDN